MPTPIGNLADITLRALETLASVDLVLCEDTRRTRKLLSAHDLGARLLSYHEHNEQQRTGEIVARLVAGGRVALVSDAGTPGVSDPGYRLVRAAIEAGVPVVPLPGPSAPVAALVASGLPTDRFAFLGYVPRKEQEAASFFRDIAGFSGSVIVFDSPRRVARTLRRAREVLGGARPCVLARELSKMHEEFLRGTLDEVLASLPEQLRGEVTLVFGPAPADPAQAPPANELRRRHRELVAAGADRKEALREIARATGLRRRDVYEAVILGSDDPMEPVSGNDPTDGDPR